MRIVLTDLEKVSDPQTLEEFDLNEELGVWTHTGIIYVLKNLKVREKLRVIVHEVTEYVLCMRVGLKRRYAHFVAGLIERIII